MNTYRVVTRQVWELVYEVEAENGARAREMVAGMTGAFEGTVDEVDTGLDLNPHVVDYSEITDKRTVRKAKTVQFGAEVENSE